MNASAYQRQQGAALAVSLILLVALTILGVATLTSTRFQEQITSNAQQKSVAFEAAESAIAKGSSDRDVVFDAIKNPPRGQYNNPDPVFPENFATELSEEFDQQNAFGKNVDISSSVSIQYCGENTLPVGSELTSDLSKARVVWMLVDFNGTADITNSNARAEHTERRAYEVPETMRSGNCVPPGL